MQMKHHHRLLALLMTVVMIFQITVMTPFAAFAEDTDTSIISENVKQQVNIEADIASDELAAGEEEPLRAAETKAGTTVLAFSSDVHNTSDNTAANRISTMIDIITRENGTIDVFGFWGDMGGASLGESAFWTCTKSVMDIVSGKNFVVL